MSFQVFYILFFVITLVGLPKVLASNISYYWFSRCPVLWKHLLLSLLFASIPYFNLPAALLTIIGWVVILTEMWKAKGDSDSAWWNKPVFKRFRSHE
jgi:hypothetical protein